jgi:hypothetical protein
MYEDEYMLIRVTSAFKRLVLHIEKKPSRSKFLFVGVSWDKALIDKLDADGLPIGNQAITDREKIARFIHVLNKKPDNHKFIVMDIFFKDPSPSDSMLQTEFRKLKNHLVSYHKRHDQNVPDLPVIKADHGLSDYENSEEGLLGISAGGFAKYKLIQGDTLKTLPLRMFEKLNNRKLENGWLYDVLDDGTPVFPTFVVDHRIRSYDLFEAPDSLRYERAYLGELVNLPDDFIWELTKDKIIIMGDFEDRDLHETIYGSMPGPLILTNAYLALENLDNRIYWLFILLLFIGYFLISYKCFYSRDFIVGTILSKWFGFVKLNRLTLSFLGYFFFFMALSLLSFFLFDTHLSILLLAVYMEVIDTVRNWIIKFIARRRMKNKSIAVN